MGIYLYIKIMMQQHFSPYFSHSLSDTGSNASAFIIILLYSINTAVLVIL